jgi:hypothetical protein
MRPGSVNRGHFIDYISSHAQMRPMNVQERVISYTRIFDVLAARKCNCERFGNRFDRHCHGLRVARYELSLRSRYS